MKAFRQTQICFIKSNNSITKINITYLKSIAFFTIYILLLNLILKNYSYIANYLITILLTTITITTITYLINVQKKEKSFIKLFAEDNVLSVSLALSPFLVSSSIKELLLVSLITVISKKSIKGINLSSILYGILFLYIYRYFQNDLNTPLTNLAQLNYFGTYSEVVTNNGSILSYILGYNYLSPLISLLALVYLFVKKSIKYNLAFSYIITYTTMMLIIGIFNHMSIWFVFFQLVSGNILYYVTYALGDSAVTPETSEGQILYGYILGIISVILRFIVPETSIIIAIILGHLLLTPLVRKIMVKLKYDYKSSILYFGLTTILSVITIIILIIIK